MVNYRRLKNKLRAPLESIKEISEPIIHLTPRILHNTLGGLLSPAQISLFHSSERAPLSILAHSIVVSAARMNDTTCVYLDSGNNYSPSLVRSLCTSSIETSNISQRIIVGQVLGLDDVVDKITMLKEMENVPLIVLDSLTGTLNLTDNPGTKRRQRTLFGALDSIRHLINTLDTHIMITDHSSQNWSSGIPQPIGGNVLSHAVDNVILVDRLRTGDDLFRILIERSTLSSPQSAVVIRIGARGIRSIR